MGSKLNTRGGSIKRGRDRGPPPPIQEQLGILVQDLLLDKDYDMYIEKFQSKKDVAPRFNFSLSEIQVD